MTTPTRPGITTWTRRTMLVTAILSALVVVAGVFQALTGISMSGIGVVLVLAVVLGLIVTVILWTVRAARAVRARHRAATERGHREGWL